MRGADEEESTRETGRLGPGQQKRDKGWTRQYPLDTSLADILNDWEAKLS
jgi:hypothetical protein